MQMTINVVLLSPYNPQRKGGNEHELDNVLAIHAYLCKINGSYSIYLFFVLTRPNGFGILRFLQMMSFIENASELRKGTFGCLVLQITFPV